MGKEKLDIVEFGVKKPVEEFFVTKYKEFETNCKNWIAKPSFPLPAAEAAIVTFIGAAQGAAFSLSYDTIFKTFVVAPLLHQPQALCLSGRRLVEARSFAVQMGAEAGIRCVLKKSTGRDDIQTRMAAGFCSGILFGLVRGNQPAGILARGVFFGLENVLILKLIEMPKKGQEEDILYNETRSMLSTLGYEKYEKNFKKGMLTDHTLPLVTDSVLREVKIPPGARLRILDHIKRREKESEGVGGDLAV